MKRRTKGSGSIRKRGRGFCAVISTRNPDTGARTRKWSPAFPTKIAAQAELTRMLGEPGQHRPSSQRETLATIVASYIADRKARGASPTTLGGYYTIAGRLDGVITCIPISRLTDRDVDVFYARLRARPINVSRNWTQRQSPRTISTTSIHHTHNLLRAATRWAKRHGRITADPMEHVEAPKRKKVQGDAIRSDDIAALLREISGHRFEPALLFALATGMRRGEICGLHAHSVNRTAKTALVREARADDGHGGWRQKTTKTERAREVPLNGSAMRALALEGRVRKKRMALAGSAWYDSGFAFVDEVGAPISPDALTDAFRRAFARVEAVTGRHHRLHDLRHTAATLMFSAGDLGAVRDVLGHADASTTLRIYTHAIEGGKRRAVDVIDKAIRAKTSRR
jgi:integrase